VTCDPNHLRDRNTSLDWFCSRAEEVELSIPFPRPATTILVVDDQRFARRVAYRILSEAGYRVLEAEDSEEALDALRIIRGRVDLLMIDVVLPGLDGVELANHVREEWPDRRILFMSAYAAEVLAEHGLAYLDVPFLAKPYTRGEVRAKVREALERRQAPRQGSRK
jgi:two-component system cell cycle sensor histidine kinase/response regulator CckA